MKEKINNNKRYILLKNISNKNKTSDFYQGNQSCNGVLNDEDIYKSPNCGRITISSTHACGESCDAAKIKAAISVASIIRLLLLS